MGERETRVEQHAHRGEEDPAERIPERQDVGQGLHPVFGLRDYQTRDERADRER